MDKVKVSFTEPAFSQALRLNKDKKTTFQTFHSHTCYCNSQAPHSVLSPFMVKISRTRDNASQPIFATELIILTCYPDG